MLDYFTLTRKLQNEIESAAADLASGLHGRLERGGLWRGMPKVHISREGIPVQVTFFNGGARIPQIFTRFMLCGTHPEIIQMRIRNKGVLTRLLGRLGARSIETGDSDFDRLFIVKAKDEALAQLLLRSKTRRSITLLSLCQGPLFDQIAKMPDAAKRLPDDTDRATMKKLMEFMFAPSRPTFELNVDNRGLCLQSLGLVKEVKKAQLLLDELTSLYSDWQLSRRFS